MKCAGKNKRGEPCGMAPLTGSEWCFAHDPARGRDRAKARKKGGHNRRTPKVSQIDAEQVCLRTVEAVQELLEGAVADTLGQENSAQRSRTLGYLAGLALKALEVGELEQRMAALEQLVAQRRSAAEATT